MNATAGTTSASAFNATPAAHARPPKLERHLQAHPQAQLTIEQVVALTGISRRAAMNAVRMLMLEGSAEWVMIVRRPANRAG